MNSRRLRIGLALLALISGFLIWWYAPTQVLKRQTKSFFDLLSLEEGTSPASRSLGSFSLEKLVDQTLETDVPSYEMASGNFRREEVSSGYQWLCQQAKQTQFRIIDFNSIQIQNEQAEVAARLQVKVIFPMQAIETTGIAYLSWRKCPDGWKLAKVRWQE